MAGSPKTLLLLVALTALGGCEFLQPPGEDPVLTKLNELERRMQAIERVVLAWSTGEEP